MLSFFPRDVLDEILNLIQSVSDVFLPTLENCVFFSLHFVPFFLRLSSFKNAVRSLRSLSECDGGFSWLITIIYNDETVVS